MAKKKGAETRSHRTLPMPLIAAVVAALVCAVASWTAYQLLLVPENQKNQKAAAERLAAQQADRASHFIDDWQQQLDQFVLRPSVYHLVTTDNGHLRQTVWRDLRDAFPGLIQAKLVTLDQRELLNSEAFEPSFIELDIINQAERRNSVVPESMNGEAGQFFMFVAPVSETEEDGSASVIATLLLGIPKSTLTSVLNQGDGSRGLTQVFQKVSAGNPQNILSHGNGGSSIKAKAYIKDSPWYVEFTPDVGLAREVSVDPMPLLGISLLFSAVIVGVAFGLVRHLTRPAPIDDEPQVRPNRKNRETKAAEAPAADDIFDLDISKEDEALLGLSDAPNRQAAAEAPPAAGPASAVACPESVFRAYDIRGLVGDKEITPDFAFNVGQSVGSEAIFQGQSGLFVARDGRQHSPALADKLIEGVLSTGCNVVDLGAVPTPLLYFAANTDPQIRSGVVVTASHNPADYNGFKVMVDGKTLADMEIQALRQRIVNGDIESGQGQLESRDIVPEYIDRIFSDVALADRVKVVIDAGNGVTGEIAPRLFGELGCDVIPLYCEVDGRFPNHEADPSREENLQDLIAKVKETGADLGLAFDGDGDRLGVVTASGQIIWPDRLLMLFVKDIVSGNPGCDVLFDVKCSRTLNSLITSYGGRPIMWKSGHSHMKAKMAETGALLGGELSGHIFIKERWYGFDDGLYAAARLLEIMTLRDQPLDEIFESFPVQPATPEIKITVDEADKFGLIESLARDGQFETGQINNLDGLRVDFARGWGLVRASNTSPALTLRFEAESEADLDQLQALFKRELLKASPELKIPF